MELRYVVEGLALESRIAPGRARQQGPSFDIHRLVPHGDFEYLPRARQVVLVERERSAKQLDLTVRVQSAGRAEQRCGARRLGGGRSRVLGDDRRGLRDLVRLADPEDEPGAREHRDYHDKRPGEPHGRIIGARRRAGIDDVSTEGPAVSVVVPNWNGRGWLPGCLGSVYKQQLAAAELIVVDNGSEDDSLSYLRAEHPDVRVISLGRNTGFAHAVNRGLEASRSEFIAVLNTDVVLTTDWLMRMVAALARHPDAAAVACKMLSLDRSDRLYDAGDVLRRDGACEQRGRYGRDDGRWDKPGEVFGACAGAALYRHSAVAAVGGFDERYFAYLEDVDLALRLQLAGWRCRYEPAVALHAGEGSSGHLPGGHLYLVERNTLVLIAKAFPLRWLPLVAYRQAAWAWHALKERRLRRHLAAAAAALPMFPGALRARRELRQGARVPIETVVPSLPIRGSRAGGHPAQIAGTWGGN